MAKQGKHGGGKQDWPEQDDSLEDTFEATFDESAPSSAEAHPFPLLMTTSEVADVLAISPRTIRRYVAAGLLTPIRLGRQARFDTKDVQALIQSAMRVGASGRERCLAARSASLVEQTVSADENAANPSICKSRVNTHDASSPGIGV